MMRHFSPGIRVLRFLCLCFGLLAVMLFIAHFALQYPVAASAVKAWMASHRLGWFIWRLMLYAAIGWGVWKVWHAPGFRAEYRRPMIRMLIISGIVVMICESVILGREA